MTYDPIIRSACREDAATIEGLIREMARFEKLEDQLMLTSESLERSLFDQRKADAFLLEVDGKAAGYAIFFENFSTFEGRAGIYLEDIFIAPEFRKQGLGKALFKAVAAEAVRRDCPRLEWACLDWNHQAIEFYRSLRAQPLEEWTVYRLTGKDLEQAAKG
jgi:GNAT superfamily N-acetyltransferase